VTKYTANTYFPSELLVFHFGTNKSKQMGVVTPRTTQYRRRSL